jgi:integrase
MSGSAGKGIRRTAHGWQVYARVRGQFRSKHLPADSTPEELQRERDRLTLGYTLAPKGGTLADDVAAYLSARRTMRSYQDRKLHLEQWAAEIGPVPRGIVTSLDVRRVLERWKEQGLSPASLNRRRTALMSFYSVIEPGGHNPAKLVPRYRETVKPLQLPTRANVLKTIAAIGTGKKGQVTRARLLVLAWTGWPAAQLMRLEPKDIKWRQRAVYLRGRRKGSGSRDAILPLLPQALAALRQFRDVDAWGEFSTSGMHKSVRHACKVLKLPRWHPYALRHLFLSEMAALTRDDRVVAELGMHTSPAQTRRYTESTVSARLTAALKLAGQQFS